MSRAASIHIGVNQPCERSPGQRLRHSEDTAWKMAGLAQQAGYRSITVLQGAEATRQAVHDALARAATTLASGDTLLVSFSGHGTRRRDLMVDKDERDDCDEAWCLSDSVLVDDQVVGYWRLFDAGVRIVAVTESCYGGGMGRDWDRPVPQGSATAALGSPGIVYRGSPPGEVAPADPWAPCIAAAPRHADGIGASLLLLSACGEHQVARDGLFSKHLLDIWSDGAFGGSYCELYRQVHQRVATQACGQQPRISMFGAPDHRFSIEPAFHVHPWAAGRTTVYR
ncbi:MAG TPA: caspase family protein [Longimicrobiaceae bacterium]|jgi:hypothetical protein|nr:caspase family protein [Longimicrobiaceae bacterium]